MTSEDKRNALRERITTAQQRLSNTAADHYARIAARKVVDFAKGNPLLLIGGGLALGLTLGSLSRRSSRAAATAAGLLGRIATDAAIAFALAMYERATQQADQDDEGEAEADDAARQAP